MILGESQFLGGSWLLCAADEITLKAENAAENASAAQPAAEPENTQRAADLSAPDDADGVLVAVIPAPSEP
jgi:hypothetical protein